MDEPPTNGAATEAAPQLTIEMRGPNIVIRSTCPTDEHHASALADAVNAASLTQTAVVIDPEPVRCDDVFAATRDSTSPTGCIHHDSCEPIEVEVLNSRMIRIPAERNSWTIDLMNGRFSQAAPRTDVLYLGADAWIPVIAIMVTPTRLTALTTSGTMISANRAHRSSGTSTSPRST